jgi:hypothetical protein
VFIVMSRVVVMKSPLYEESSLTPQPELPVLNVGMADCPVVGLFSGKL